MTNTILNNLTEDERKAALEILKQISDNGVSDRLNSLMLEDWAEIPVDIETFLHDRRYLGNALYDQEGNFTLFPYWEQKLKEIFPTNTTTRFNTIIFTGAIGLGKSTIAVICLLYLLYRLLCLKDPYLYYGMQPIDKISISLMNITIENAKGVALDKMNQMILSSEWFMSHGHMSGITNLEYIPDKHIELIVGSSNNQVIGRAIFGNFCLSGDTIIDTDTGCHKLEDLVDKPIKVYTLNDNGKVTLSEQCTVEQTNTVKELIELELEDNTIIKCTPEHKFMLIDGTYKMAKYLTPEDEIMGNLELATQGDNELSTQAIVI